MVRRTFRTWKPYFEEAYLWKTQRVSQAGSAEVISTHKSAEGTSMKWSFPFISKILCGCPWEGQCQNNARPAIISCRRSLLQCHLLDFGKENFKTPEFLVVRQFFLVFPTRGNDPPKNQRPFHRSVQGSSWAIGMEVVWAASRACQCLRFRNATWPADLGGLFVNHRSHKSIVGLDCCFF